MVPKDTLVGVVISGGKSSRMGTDKSLLLWNNKPFYLHAAEILAPFCSEIYVSCNVSQSNNYILQFQIVSLNEKQSVPMLLVFFLES